MAENLTQKTAQDLAVLQNNLLTLLLSGEMGLEQIEWYLALSKNQRGQLLNIAPLLRDEIPTEQLEWFVSLSKEKKEQLQVIMPQSRAEEDPAPVDNIVSEEGEGEKEEVTESTSEIFSRIRTPQILAKDTAILKLVSGLEKLIIKAFDFEETKLTRTDIFKASGFDDCKHLKSNKTPDSSKSRTRVLVYELAIDATFSEIFGSIGVGLTRLCFKTEQIRNFCIKHSAWLAPNGFPTYFLLRDSDKFFVIRVLFDAEDLSLKIVEEPLECPTIWPASEFRHVIVPDLNNQEF